MIYLDNNATTRIAPEVRAAMEPFLDEYYANPSSPYTFARASSLAIQQAREQVAALLAVESRQVIFTSGGSESINAAFHAACHRRPDRRRIILSAVEHAATLRCAERLEQAGYEIVYIPVDTNGLPDTAMYRAHLSDDTALVSLMAANNETGVLYPVEEWADAAHERDILFHCDATQAIGKVPFQAGHPGYSYISISGHKFHAPKGIGALVVQAEHTLPPLVVGGEQEQGQRAGTENVLGIVGLGAAAALAGNAPADMDTTIRPLRGHMEATLNKQAPTLRVVGAGAPRLPNTTLCLVPDIPSDVLLAQLDMKDICCSSGSACASGAAESSHVLAAMGWNIKDGFGAVRISLSRYTSPVEIETFLDRMCRILSS